MQILYKLGSVRFALLGFITLFIAMFAGNRAPEMKQWLLLFPLGLLSLNLIVAILFNAKIKRSLALTLFHLSFLVLIILIAYGQLVRFNGRVELVTGQSLDSAIIEPLSVGLWYRSKIDTMAITQGRLEVNYAPELYRQKTHSRLLIYDSAEGQRERTIGDDIPLAIDGYRFYTTPNKGFSTIVSWIDKASGEQTTGAINFPSFPAKEWSQKQQWVAPDGETISLQLNANVVSDANRAWKLSSENIDAELEIIKNNRVVPLPRGAALEFDNGMLRLEQIQLWMGYKVTYDPTLRWLFLVAVFGIGTMAWYLHQRVSIKSASFLPG